jgi:hypothetical protein
MTTINISFSNIRTTQRNKDPLLLHMQTHNTDIMCLNETRLAPLSKFQVPAEFEMKRIDKARNSGGVAFIVKKSLRVIPVTLPRVNNGNINATEAIAIAVKYNTHRELCILCMYQSPTRATDIVDTSIIDHVTSLYDDVIIIGDFNARHLQLDANYTGHQHIRGVSLVNYINGGNNIIVLSDPWVPTRYGQGNNTSLLDLVMSTPSASMLVEDLYVSSPIGSSDHETIDISLNARVERQTMQPRLIYQWRRANWHLFQETLTHAATNIADIQQQLQQSHPAEWTTRIDAHVDTITAAITEATNIAVPKKQYKPKAAPKPSQYLQQLISDRKRVKRRMRTYNDLALRVLRNQLNRDIKRQSEVERQQCWEQRTSEMNHYDLTKAWKTLKVINGESKEENKSEVIIRTNPDDTVDYIRDDQASPTSSNTIYSQYFDPKHLHTLTQSPSWLSTTGTATAKINCPQIPPSKKWKTRSP